MGKLYHVIYAVIYSDASWDTLANQQVFIFNLKKKKLTLKKVILCQVTLVHRCLLRSHKKTESGFPKSW